MAGVYALLTLAFYVNFWEKYHFSTYFAFPVGFRVASVNYNTPPFLTRPEFLRFYSNLCFLFFAGPPHNLQRQCLSLVVGVCLHLRNS